MPWKEGNRIYWIDIRRVLAAPVGMCRLLERENCVLAASEACRSKWLQLFSRGDLPHRVARKVCFGTEEICSQWQG
jgi:hypothetical protein